MPTLPALDKNVNHSPHVVILGAGASLAAFPNGESHGFRLPLMNNFIEVVGLEEMLEQADIDCENLNFEAFYDDLLSSDANPKLVADIEAKVLGYFSKMNIPESTTIYDYLVLSLREKDIIATFNWDPFLVQALRRNLSVRRLPQTVFLHGNVGVGICLEHKRGGYVKQVCDVCKRPLSPTKLLYPVKHKDYNSDLFIKDQWDRLGRHINHSYFLTIFGYSAPVTDVEARSLMLKVWKKNKTRELAQIEIVDIKTKEELVRTWDDFIYSHHYGVSDSIFNSYLFRYPRRSCDAFAETNLMNRPWKDNHFPKLDSITELHEWIRPLLDEEEQYDKFKAEFSGLPCDDLRKKL